MNEIEDRSAYGALSRLGTQAAVNLGGGALLLVMTLVGGRLRVLGAALGLLVGCVGLGGLRSHESADRKAGLFCLGAGALELAFSAFRGGLVKSLAGSVLVVGGLGLLALGIWRGLRFLVGLKKSRD